MFLMNRLWKTNRWIRNERDSIADGALQCVARLVGGAHIGNERRSAAKGKEAFTLVGSVK